jgi:hypothetical protein
MENMAAYSKSRCQSGPPEATQRTLFHAITAWGASVRQARLWRNRATACQTGTIQLDDIDWGIKVTTASGNLLNGLDRVCVIPLGAPAQACFYLLVNGGAD